MLTVKYAGAGPHPSRGFTACPWKICVAAFASPLFVTFIRRWCGHRREIFLAAHGVENFMSPLRVSLVCFVCAQAVRTQAGDFPFISLSWKFCVARFACVPCAIVSLHEEADPHTMSKFFVVCESASCVCDTSAKGSRRKARRKTVREHRHAHRTRPALIAGQFVRAALYLCGLPLTCSPAPRRDDVRPLEKETMRFLKNRRRRGGLTRPAVCTVPAACRSVAFPLAASAQGITN